MSTLTLTLLILSYVILIGALLVIVGFARGWFTALRQKFSRKPRWWIEEIRCNKCQGSSVPGTLTHGRLDPITEEWEEMTFECDRCEGTGHMKMVLTKDGITPEEFEQIREEVMVEFQKDRIKRESEVER